jgi:hypothetical protein
MLNVMILNNLSKNTPALRRAKKDPRFKSYFEGDRNGGLAVSIVRHEKARKRLCIQNS